MYSSALYRCSPIWLQNLILSVRAHGRQVLREGPIFKAELAEVERTQWLDSSAMRGMQFARLRQTLELAARDVPYYRDAFALAGFELAAFRTLADLERVPVLTKATVMREGPRMLATDYSGLRSSSSTSGTTGAPMRVWRDMHSISRENAFLWRQLKWAGARLGDRRVWIRGDRIVPVERQHPPFWRYSGADNMIMMSPYHLSEASYRHYIKALEEFDPVFGMAYPSILLFLAKTMLNDGTKYRGKSLKGFVTSSETITKEGRLLIEKAFQCKVFDWYGSAERVTAIGTCEAGNYHILSDYGMTELIPAPDGTSEIIGTAFYNHLMPLIRYEIGDSVVPGEKRYECPCGRSYPVVEQIIGRVEDYLIAPGGRRVFLASDLLENVNGVLESQIRQDSLEEIRILCVPTATEPFDECDLVHRARQLFGNDMRVTVERVPHIQRTRNGKLRAVVRTIDA